MPPPTLVRREVEPAEERLMSIGHEAAPMAGWIINGFETLVVLATWVGVVVLYGLWRSLNRPEPDPIRPSGPTGQ